MGRRQYNERLLWQLHDEVFACRFGTFLCNCDRERRQLALQQRTPSVWAMIAAKRDDFVNPLYTPREGVLPISSAPQHIALWRTLYLRQFPYLQSAESRDERVAQLAGRKAVLRGLQLQLARRLASACRAANVNGALEQEIRTALSGTAWAQSDVGVAGDDGTAGPHNNSVVTVDDANGTTRPLEAPLVPMWDPRRRALRCRACQRPLDSLCSLADCPLCGEVVCADCARRSLAVPPIGLVQPVRVCNQCSRTLRPTP